MACVNLNEMIVKWAVEMARMIADTAKTHAIPAESLIMACIAVGMTVEGGLEAKNGKICGGCWNNIVDGAKQISAHSTIQLIPADEAKAKLQ